MGSAFDFQGSCPARARGCGYWGGGGFRGGAVCRC